MLQILTNRDFQLFVVMNFFQVFILAFFNNFTMIFTEHLIPPDVLPSLAKSIVYGAGFICPQVQVFLGFFSLVPYEHQHHFPFIVNNSSLLVTL